MPSFLPPVSQPDTSESTANLGQNCTQSSPEPRYPSSFSDITIRQAQHTRVNSHSHRQQSNSILRLTHPHPDSFPGFWHHVEPESFLRKIHQIRKENVFSQRERGAHTARRLFVQEKELGQIGDGRLGKNGSGCIATTNKTLSRYKRHFQTSASEHSASPGDSSSWTLNQATACGFVEALSLQALSIWSWKGPPAMASLLLLL